MEEKDWGSKSLLDSHSIADADADAVSLPFPSPHTPSSAASHAARPVASSAAARAATAGGISRSEGIAMLCLLVKIFICS
ncbi:hypothetical protein GUJ93_ZPchr0002g25403 [Zizania palustris]|uniref:Uncharacterized protein n=1 Tax=Zizania palustris TaxID=103762 RepID=A0A8J5S6D1_ZIZPA|nr:hypothetical protein GUJ93_ZPchr0002g25403 [Zizania palustris]